MYWFNLNCNRFILLTFILLPVLTPSCKSDVAESGRKMKFFDLKGYFSADSARLAKQNPVVTKTIIYNKAVETKKVHIADWGTEFRMFTASDINKAAWQQSYTTQITPDFEIYKAKYPELETREILIKKQGLRVKWILIFRYSKNFLFQTREKLSYFPDSLYLIEKTQKVRLLKVNSYKIKGSFR